MSVRLSSSSFRPQEVRRASSPLGIKRLYNHAHTAAASLSLSHQHCHYHKQSTNVCDLPPSTGSRRESGRAKCSFVNTQSTIGPASHISKDLEKVSAAFPLVLVRFLAHSLLDAAAQAAALIPPLTRLPDTHGAAPSARSSPFLGSDRKRSLTLRTLQAESAIDLLSRAPAGQWLSCVFDSFHYGAGTGARGSAALLGQCQAAPGAGSRPGRSWGGTAAGRVAFIWAQRESLRAQASAAP